MAISSYGDSTDSSGIVRILKDLDINIEGRHVLVVDGEQHAVALERGVEQVEERVTGV
jgi:hypothetical protein